MNFRFTQWHRLTVVVSLYNNGFFGDFITKYGFPENQIRSGPLKHWFSAPLSADIDFTWSFRYLKEYETNNIDFADIYSGMPVTKSRHTPIIEPQRGPDCIHWQHAVRTKTLRMRQGGRSRRHRKTHAIHQRHTQS